MNFLKSFNVPVAVLVVAGSFHAAAIAQAAPATAAPVDPIVEELKRRLNVLEAEKATIEAEVDRNKARLELLQQQFPVITGGNSGSIKFEASKGAYAIGAWEMVFQRMAEGASELCKSLNDTFKSANLKEVILVSEDDLQLPAAYIIVSGEQKRLQLELDAILVIKVDKPSVEPPPVVASIPAIGAIFNSAVSIAKLFRTDITLHPEATTVNVTSVKDEIAKCLSTRQIIVNYPALFARHALLSSSGSEFLVQLQKLSADRRSAESKVLQMPSASRPANALPLFAQVDKFMGDLVGASAVSAEVPLLSVVRGEAIQLGLANNTSMLMVGIPQQGGLSMITSNVWRSDRLFVGGGMIISYRLSNKGSILASGTIAKVDPKMKRVTLD